MGEAEGMQAWGGAFGRPGRPGYAPEVKQGRGKGTRVYRDGRGGYSGRKR